MSTGSYDGWTAVREISFLDGIMTGDNLPMFSGKSKVSIERSMVSIKQTLQNYLATIDQRRWDADIDVPAIRLHAQSLLARCR